MAIGRVNYSELRRTPNSNTSVAATERAGTISQRVYSTDTHTRENFPTLVGTKNPLHDTFESSLYSDEKGHVYEFINKFKICDLAVVSAGRTTPPEPNDSAWGSWRGNEVSPNIFLYPEEKSFTFGYKHNYTKAWAELSDKGLLSKVQQLAEAARAVAMLSGSGGGTIPAGGRFMSRYKEAPAWTGVNPISLSSSLKFTFQFGQAGIFSGEHEVVRPIITLARLFRPLEAEQNYFKGPIPTPPAYLAGFLTTLSDVGLRGIMSDSRSMGEDGEAAGGIVRRVTDIEANLIRTTETVIRTTLANDSRALCIRMGRMTWGPAVVNNVDWSFDFTQVDEYGFPYQGTLTFGGLESILIPTNDQFSTLFRL